MYFLIAACISLLYLSKVSSRIFVASTCMLIPVTFESFFNFVWVSLEMRMISVSLIFCPGRATDTPAFYPRFRLPFLQLPPFFRKYFFFGHRILMVRFGLFFALTVSSFGTYRIGNLFRFLYFLLHFGCIGQELAHTA